MNSHEGRCHCGNIRFLFETNLSPDQLNFRKCGCSFCTRTGGVYTSDPNGRLTVSIHKAQEPYCFGHRTADFHVCKHCGCTPVITCDIEGSLKGIINALMIDGFNLGTDMPQPLSYEAETPSDRLARRAKTWISHVQFDVAASGAPPEHS